MSFDIEKQLEKIRVNPLSSSEKEKVWLNVENIIIRSKSHGIFNKYKKFIAAFLVFILGFSSLGTVAYADGSRPGDLLFPIDIASENIRLAFSWGNKQDSLRLEFAQERIDEVRSIVFASNNFPVFITVTAPDNVATTHKNSNKTVEVIKDDIATSSQIFKTLAIKEKASNESNEEAVKGTSKLEAEDTAGINTKILGKANLAFQVALDQLEDTRSRLLLGGNSLAVLAMDEMIAELTKIAEDHVSQLNNVTAKIKDDNNKLKIDVAANTDKIKAKFKFVENKSGDESGISIAVSQSINSSKTKLSNGKIKTELTIKDKGGKKKDDEDDDDEDSHDDDNNNKKITICHKNSWWKSGNTISVSKNALWAHAKHGDKIGRCNAEDNDNGTTTPDTIPPLISNIRTKTTTTSARISWDTNEKSDSAVYYSTTTPISVSSAQKKRSDNKVKTHLVELMGLSTSTTHYFIITSKDTAGNTATSSENTFTTTTEPQQNDTSAPKITGIQITSVATSSAKVKWNTDENADSRLWIETSSGVDSSETPNHRNNSLTTGHTINLSSLSASTTYFIIIGSKDESGNLATTTEHSFTTAMLSLHPDTTAPVISSVSTSEISSTTAKVMWTTDENANSVLWFDKMTPLLLTSSTTIKLQNNVLTKNHELNLNNLTASTTYFYRIASTDETNNTATSTEFSFITLK